MDPAMQITVTMIGSVGAFLFSLIVVAILVRVVGEKQDSAAEERKTLLERIKQHDNEILREIKLMRDEMKDHRRINNYIVFNHTANRIIGDVAGTVGPEGGVIKFRPFEIEPKYKAHRVRLLAILVDGEDARLY